MKHRGPSSAALRRAKPPICTIIDYAFTELKAHKIFAETIDVEKSVRLMEKLGMRLEGIQRSQTKDSRGNWSGLYLYGVLEDDWRKAI